MVKKLFKHEFIAYGRIMAIVYAIILTIAAATRIVLLFESDTVAYEIVESLCMIFYVISAFSAFIFGYALMLVRFYKNLFTAEGYLSFTLPVTTDQHILVKGITAVSFTLMSLVVLLLSTCIVTAGESFMEYFNAFRTNFAYFYDYMGLHTVAYIAEFAIFLLVALFASTFLYYSFIAIGQLFKKNRILASVGAYFVYYILSQIVSTIFMVVFAIFSETSAFFNLILWIGDHPFATIHILLWCGILIYAAAVFIEYIVVKTIISKKLNLE